MKHSINPPFFNFKTPLPLNELPKLIPSTSPPNPQSKEDLEEFDIDQRYSSYVRRNVCKSIVRNLNSYFRKNKSTVQKRLLEAGYLDEEIRKEVISLKLYNEAQLKQDSKTFQRAIEEILENKVILTYLLKLTLDQLIASWEEGNHGKIASRNLKSYKEICQPYYKKAIQILAKEKPILLMHNENF